MVFFDRDDGRGDESSRRGCDVSSRRKSVWRRRFDRFRLQHGRPADARRGAFRDGCGGLPEGRAEPETTPGGSFQQVSSRSYCLRKLEK